MVLCAITNVFKGEHILWKMEIVKQLNYLVLNLHVLLAPFATPVCILKLKSANQPSAIRQEDMVIVHLWVS